MAVTDTAIELRTGESIPLQSLEFSTSRSGGPGGQNVNKVETKVEVRLMVADTPYLNETTRQILLQRLASKLDTQGVLRLTCSTERTQLGNRVAIVERLQKMLNAALAPVKQRRPTKPSAAMRQRRLDEKKKSSEKKGGRRWTPEE